MFEVLYHYTSLWMHMHEHLTQCFMSLALNRNLAIQNFEHSEAIEIRDKIRIQVLSRTVFSLTSPSHKEKNVVTI